MPRLQEELDALRIAEEQIRVAEETVSRLQSAPPGRQAASCIPPEAALLAARNGLQHLYRRRNVIQKTIASMQAGRLPRG